MFIEFGISLDRTFSVNADSLLEDQKLHALDRRN
jgi:hypothetical protein